MRQHEEKKEKCADAFHRHSISAKSDNSRANIFDRFIFENDKPKRILFAQTNEKKTRSIHHEASEQSKNQEIDISIVHG